MREDEWTRSEDSREEQGNAGKEEQGNAGKVRKVSHPTPDLQIPIVDRFGVVHACHATRHTGIKVTTTTNVISTYR